MPTVSVCMPVFNKSATVERSLLSVLRQTHVTLELFVVDDGSMDESAQIVRAISDPRIRLLEQANSGPGAARNRAWREAKGELVAFLDADDFWDPDFLARATSVFAAHPAVTVYTGGHRSLTRAGTVMGTREWPGAVIRPGFFRVTPRTPEDEVLARLTYMFPVTTVVRRELLERYGGYFDRDRCTYGEDSFLWAKALFNEPCFMDIEPSVTVDRTASELSTLDTLAHRPLEPLLKFPEEFLATCSAELRPLAERLLAHKAYKRSCTLAAVGRRAEARDLRQRLARPGGWLSGYGAASLLATTALGAWLARLAVGALRRVRRE
jgi:glycosyltransferase involved in cell wall biosynthesis